MVKKHKEYNIKHREKLPASFIIVLSVIVVLLIVGAFFIFTTDEKLDYSQYNSFRFTKIGNNWQTMVEMNDQLYEVPFYNHPYDISGINYNNNVTVHLMDVINTVKPKREIVIAVHPDSGSVPVLAGVNIARITGKFYETKTSSALYLSPEEIDSYNNTEDLPIANCDSADFYTTVVVVSLNETTKKVDFLGDNCVIVGAGNEDDLLMVADLVGYKLLGIMR